MNRIEAVRRYEARGPKGYCKRHPVVDLLVIARLNVQTAGSKIQFAMIPSSRLSCQRYVSRWEVEVTEDARTEWVKN
jgi:hypothetical protein